MIKGKNTDNYCNVCPASLRGMCCWFTYYDGTDNFIIYPCEYLSKKTRRCKVYSKRFNIKHCLSVEDALKEGALPLECAYVKESDVIPIRPHKKINIKKLEMIKNGIKEGRFSASNSLGWAKSVST